ncbi:ATP-dependent RNA helicase DbpA [Ralstonia pickettii]|uniref:DEAD/DEAH box helicase family protein n=2 Tax=Pseudomonadota TaxID=1224 RepID=UPI000500D3F1|nr:MULTISPECIES: DEAD/DEAH box helicase family protein [Ralstonia]KFL24380.1 DEAD/DEAH box helicase family protein [Ralstonia pickettii]MBU6522433.1 DEAD/DEAH box helicase family protein [Ralstonia sp. B265]QQK33822.1 hypothetical protein RP6297_00004 [Ralstonia pickettii]UCA15797.1 DEAD/DEAH box helicase family protein [Ralstonia pickettii]SUE01041.1 ATP-dependent RNA helicase DbpA [Ralstonia pickettii]
MSPDTGLARFSFSTEYRTGDIDPVSGFYRPCLLNSIDYKRAVGYFRSSVYLIVGPATVEFAKRGGKIRLVCSPSVTTEDMETIEAGYEARIERVAANLGEEIDRMLASENTAYRTRVLATLISAGALDIRLALRPEGYGLYHEKIGIFRDAVGNRVSFLGSANETWNGWHSRGNHEAIEVFCSWRNGAERERVERHDSYFERLWDGTVTGVDVVPFPEAAKKRLQTVSLEGIDTVDMDALDESAGKRAALPHQLAAIEAWKRAGSRGIFEHATGSGKTYTALLAVKEHTAKGLPALILVPSALLLEQWAIEIRDELPEAILLRAGSGHNRWKQAGRLAGLTDPSPEFGPRVILATMQTAATDAFLADTCGGAHLLVIADEVHQIGSPYNARAMGIESGSRLGLSATPIRYGDPEGTAKILAYFGPVIPPAISLRDAIRSGRLVEYEYHPHPVHLTAEEAESWKVLTRRIFLEINKTEGDVIRSAPLNEKAKMLLIQRSRIAKKAQGKIPLAVEVLRSAYRKGQRWLVYCEDGHQLAEVLEALSHAGLSAMEYHTGMAGDRAAALAWFRSFGGILVSIKCLDEGVDIPAVDHALILASSQNPRQFIQRRGRVLRSAPDKHIAVIHDAVVVPLNLENEPEQLSLLKSEFVRAIEFSESALNRTAGAELRAMANTMGLDFDMWRDAGVEEEEKE